VGEVLSRTGSVEGAARYMNLALEQLAVEFKNPLFQDEQEWRLIQEAYQHSSRSLVRFAARGSYVRPYLEFRRSEEHAMSPLPIRTIICGPRLDDDIAVETVQELLSANGYSVYEIRVEVSRLRGTWR
jgi:hypothetical protein